VTIVDNISSNKDDETSTHQSNASGETMSPASEAARHNGPAAFRAAPPPGTARILRSAPRPSALDAAAALAPWGRGSEGGM